MSRLAVLAPFAFPSVRGNAVTLGRIVAGLRGRGLDVRVWDLSVTDSERVGAEVEAWEPALIHGFHAFRVGPLALRLARKLDVPLVLTLTGTDANHDLFDPVRTSAVREVLQGASAVVAFHESIVERVVGLLPDLRPRMAVVPQAVCLAEGETFDLQARWALPPDRVVFLMPGGIRMVKAPRRPLAALDPVVAARPNVRLLYAGPVLDPGEGEALRLALAGRPWARHIGVVPHAQMASLLGQVDVVLNCSISEGGMANSVLEAMAMGRAVLAADIPGNRVLVEDEVTGLLFADDPALTRAAARLAGDAALRARLGAQGRSRVQERYPPAREIAGYAAIYRRHAGVLAARGGEPADGPPASPGDRPGHSSGTA